jgi:hypothetical protein
METNEELVEATRQGVRSLRERVATDPEVSADDLVRFVHESMGALMRAVGELSGEQDALFPVIFTLLLEAALPSLAAQGAYGQPS